jgi:CRISPR-associated endonuclease/helicase Cas3
MAPAEPPPRRARTDSDYGPFFKCALAASLDPYPYQVRLATDLWPEVVHIPTGLGKTAAVVLAWLYKRLLTGTPTPRRLAYCLPMRVLVDQTAQNVRAWVDNLARGGMIAPDRKPSVHVMMGGEVQLDWDINADRELILVGTQDQLLSRALNRGYAMSRFRWPIHFGLLNNDCFWVMDETQLMGVGLKTTAQLQAFREKLATYGATHSLWMSATLDEAGLSTVDHRQPATGWRRLSLSGEETVLPPMQKRLMAPKGLVPAGTELTTDDKSFARSLAAEILRRHVPGHLSLVVVNRVTRAQQVYQELIKAGRTPDTTALVHSRFREPDRKRHEDLLGDEGDRIVVATQTVEAGVDVSARVLFTEVAPWASLVQRFGRLNRYGEYPESEAFWISSPGIGGLSTRLREDDPKLKQDKAEEKARQMLDRLCLPYGFDTIQESRRILQGLKFADINTLQRVDHTETEKVEPVIRRKDIIDLFDTSSDLSGSDIDVSRYIRNQEGSDLQVYWRDFDDETPLADLPPPMRQELCSVPIGSCREFLGKEGVVAWKWDHLSGAWQKVAKKDARNEVFPGQILLFSAGAGGYDPLLGWTGKEGNRVPQVEVPDQPANETIEDGVNTRGSKWVTISRHSQEVARECRRLAQEFSLDKELTEALVTAAVWHDVGKAHAVFQNFLAQFPGYAPGLWAKSGMDAPGTNPVTTARPARRFFRHELASALAWLQQTPDTIPDKDLIAYLIASHHGKVRLALRSLPGESKPDNLDLPFACGVWQGDELPAVDLGNGRHSEALTLNLSPMILGEGNLNPSWGERAITLRDRLGPFRLSFLEMVLRVADWRASAAE